MTTPDGGIPQLSATNVQDIHRMADTDSSQTAAHHTLGLAPTQATQGDHTHDGRNSKILPDYAPANHTHTSAGQPAGSIVMYASATIPTGWLLCDGQAVSRSTYATLYAAIGNSFGAGDGSTTFNVPDFKSRGPIGVNGASPGMGATGGSTTHSHTTSDLALTAAQMPSHTHSDDHIHSEGSHSHTEGSHSHGDDHTHTTDSHTHSDDHYHSENNHSHDQGTLKALRSTLAGASNITGVASSVNNQGSQTYDINISGNTGSNGPGTTLYKSTTGFGSTTGSGAGGSTNFKSTQGYGSTTSSAAGGGTGSNAGSGTGSKSAAGYGSSTGAAGSGNVHNHGATANYTGPLDPWLAVNFLIKT